MNVKKIIIYKLENRNLLSKAYHCSFTTSSIFWSSTSPSRLRWFCCLKLIVRLTWLAATEIHDFIQHSILLQNHYILILCNHFLSVHWHRWLGVGMYWISLFQIQLEPDLAGFMNANPARAGAGFKQICKMSMENTARMNHCDSTTKHKQETLSCSANNLVRWEIFGSTRVVSSTWQHFLLTSWTDNSFVGWKPTLVRYSRLSLDAINTLDSCHKSGQNSGRSRTWPDLPKMAGCRTCRSRNPVHP